MKRSLAISMFALLAVSGVAHGTSIAFEFLGQVNFVPPELAGQFPTGGIFTGVFGFNSGTEDGDPDPDRGLYLGALAFGHLSVESGRLPEVPNYLALISDGRITVRDDAGMPPIDQYIVQAGELGACGSGITGHSVNGWELCGFELNVVDDDTLVFDSDALPLSPPNLEEFTGGSIRLLFTHGSSSRRLRVARSHGRALFFCSRTRHPRAAWSRPIGTWPDATQGTLTAMAQTSDAHAFGALDLHA